MKTSDILIFTALIILTLFVMRNERRIQTNRTVIEETIQTIVRIHND